MANGGPFGPSDQRALQIAILKGDVEAIKVLSTAGATLERTAIQKIAQQRGAQIMKEFKDAGVGTGARSGQHGAPYSQAGAQLIREGNRIGGEIGEGLKAAGLRLIERGKGINHLGRKDDSFGSITIFSLKVAGQA